ncbi:hypothetical protein AXF42_Ash017315 [Apostasia shenzhenica]|uniref:Uncharacterized protein n=1 Tax=Apostasia shenzhenica TaxID=1088818 RepID=A0A2I0BDC2_9ASPA|nr:hypothetical protein AXF42_Ash017315 [Apostasia shenzhenica]
MALKLPIFLRGDDTEKTEIEEQGRKTEELAAALARKEEEDDVESSQSSSIGVNSPSSSDDEEEEGQSKLKDEKGFSISLDSLEESLPIKRGLSNYFSGKSKSFASLSDASSISAKDLAKPENSFNKRRRILINCKNSWRRRASYSSLMPPLPPLISPDFIVEEEEDEDRGEADLFIPLPPLAAHGEQRSLKNTFIKSSRSFSLTDLHRV